MLFLKIDVDKSDTVELEEFIDFVSQIFQIWNDKNLYRIKDKEIRTKGLRYKKVN